MGYRLVPPAAVLLPAILFATVSCATLRVPESAPSFKPDEMLHVSRAGVTLSAHPYESREQYWELFDDNLPEFGFAAVWVAVSNGRQDPIGFENAGWRLVISGRELAPISSDRVLDQYYKARNIRAVSVNTDRLARARLETLLFAARHVAPARQSDGLLMFRVEPSPSAAWMSSSRLILKDIRLSGRESLVLEMPLSYATP